MIRFGISFSLGERKVSADSIKGGIMRTAKKSFKKKVLFGIASVMTLVLCFSLVFGLTVMLGEFSPLDGIEQLSHIAKAGTVINNDKDGADSKGTATPTAGKIAASAFTFPGSSTTTINTSTTWTATETIDTVLSENNHQVVKDGGNTDLYMTVGDAGIFDFGVLNGAASYACTMVYNYKLSPFLQKIANNGNVTIKAKVSASFQTYDCKHQTWPRNATVGVYWGAFATTSSSYKKATEWQGEEKVKDLAKTGDKKEADEAEVNGTANFNEVTLTSSNNTLGIAIGFKWAGHNTKDYKRRLVVKNVKVKFTLTYAKNISESSSLKYDDGAKPVMASLYSTNTTDAKRIYTPFLDSYSSSWPVFIDNTTVRTRINQDRDTKNDNDGSATLNSYTSTPISNINGHAYYKKSEISYVDGYNYNYPANQNFSGRTDLSGLADFYNDTTGFSKSTSYACNLMTAGIKTVKVSIDGGTTATINVYDSNSVSSYHNVSKSSSVVGVVKVEKVDRSHVRVLLYMCANGTFTTTITDYGGYSNSYETVVGGIDTTKPTSTMNSFAIPALSENNKYFTSDKSNIGKVDWLRETSKGKTVLTGINGLKKAAETGKPYFWFFSAQKSDTLAGVQALTPLTLSSYSTLTGKGMKPIGFDELTDFQFEYNFQTGRAKGLGSTGSSGDNYYNVPNATGLDATGSGYYMFTFYIVDAAGNVGNNYSFYAKVDVEKPDFDIALSFDKIIDGGTENISLTSIDNKNKKWATNDVKFVITFNKINLSGNSFVFKVGKAENPSLNIISFDSEGYTINDGTTTFENFGVIATFLDPANLDIEFISDGGKAVFTFTVKAEADSDGKFPNIAWVTDIVAYAGRHSTVNGTPVIPPYDANIVTTSKEIGNSDENGTLVPWDDVNILIDKNDPNEPEISGEFWSEGFWSDKAGYTFDYKIPETRETGRVWKTDDFSLKTSLILTDSMFGNPDYVGNAVIRYGIAYAATQDELDALKEKHIENNFKNIDSANYQNYFNWFVEDFVKDRNPDVGGSVNIPENVIDLVASRKAGMRVIYVWAVDQAGNCSVLTTRFVLVDPTTYKVSVSKQHNADLSIEDTVITFGDSLTTADVKRGETLAFDITYKYAQADEGSLVPFKLTLNDNEILYNYYPLRGWYLTNDSDSKLINGFTAPDIESRHDGNPNFNYLLDSFESLANLETVEAFKLYERQVVAFTTEKQEAYQSKPLTPQVNLGENSNPKALSHFIYIVVDEAENILYLTEDGTTTTDRDLAKKDENGNPTLFHPILPGTYQYRVVIPRADGSFVTKNYQEENGVQTFPFSSKVEFSITQGQVTIKVTPTQSTFGDPIELKYTVEGFDVENQSESEKLVGSLKLNVKNWADGLINVGSYDIVEDVPFAISDNYKVTFVSEKHIVAARSVKIDTLNAAKVYGDYDPAFAFGVADNQFDWYTNRGEGYTAQAIVNVIFNGFTALDPETVDSVNYFKFAAPSGGITRDSGETVGIAYNFKVDTTKFDINSNFILSVQNKGQLTVSRRTVKLDVSGKFIVVAEGTVPDLSGIVPEFKLADADLALKSEIEALLAGKLSISGTSMTPTESCPDDYSGMTWYPILLDDSASNNNILFELGDKSYFIVYVAGASSIFVKLKDGAKFEFIFGTQWDPALVAFSSDYFVLTSEEEIPDYDTIEWTASIDGVSVGDYLRNGSHSVKVDGARLIKDGNPVEGKFVFVDSFSVKINPATIVVTPTRTANTKTYGDLESVFGISFVISTINGEPVSETGYASYSLESIMALISGSFGRARYTNVGTVRSTAGRYDDATDASGIIIDKKFGEGEYYGYYANPFIISDPNFTVSPEFDPAERFFINQKEINLDAANFLGVSKAYDGSNSVNFGSKTVYSIADQLVNPQDELSLGFAAVYTTIGSAKQATDAGIIFSSLVLEGAGRFNYKLAAIANSSNSAQLFDGTEEVRNAAVNADTRVIIYYINSNLDDEHIQIFMGTIALYKSDFNLSKQYDKLPYLEISALSVVNRSDDSGAGSSMLYQVVESGRAVFVDEKVPIGVVVKNNYVIASITIFFPIEGASGLQILTDGPYANPDVEVRNDLPFEGQEGVTVTLRNINASVTQRKLGAAQFASVSAVGRDYNSKSAVSTVYTFAEGALATGDTFASIGLNLAANISGDDFGFGTHAIVFAPIGEGTTITNTNYTVDIDDLNRYFFGANALNVDIAKAKLFPNVTFEGREYDGSAVVGTKQVSGEFAFTTVNYSHDLAAELALLTIDGTVEYLLSENGAINENVIFNEDGSVAMHNVLIRGLKIADASGKNLLKNYELYGFRYVSGSYVDAGNAAAGAAVDDYELLGAVKLDRKKLIVMMNNVIIKDKIYDGTGEADITANIVGSGIVDGHEKHLAINANGQFTKSFVGDNIPVNISGIELVALDKEGEKLFNNYVLQNYTDRRTASILPRPVAIEANLGQKVYNGSPAALKTAVSLTISGLLEGDTAGYKAVTETTAYFIDKNVALDMSGDTPVVIAKQGTIYNPIIKNNRGIVINYRPVLAFAEKQGDDYIGYVEANGTAHFGEVAPDGTEVQCYYYNLPTADKFINLTSTALLDAAKAADAIAGYFELNGVKGYAIKSGYSGSYDSNMAPMTYFSAEGMILQKTISIASDGVKMTEGSTAFTKMFDGTNIFFGKRRTVDDGGHVVDPGDYYYDTNSITGIIEGDDIRIKDITGEFDDFSTTANYVVFTVSGIDGADVNNYRVDGNVGTARIAAKILKRSLEATLADGEMVFGTNPSSVMGEITYQMLDAAGNKYDLTEFDGGLYLTYTDYIKIMGHSHDDTILALLKSRLYVFENGGFTRVPEESVIPDDMSGYFVKLSGITSLPRARASFSATVPNAGTIADSYVIADAASVNFDFIPVYSGANGSTLTVMKKDIYIAGDGKAYSKFYGAASEPSATLFYLAADGNAGVVSPDTVTSIFKVGGKDYSPVIAWMLYNTVTHTATPVDKYARISADLGPNEVYVAHFLPRDNADYSAIIANYIVHLEPKFTTADDGSVRMIYDGTAINSPAVTLEIVLPVIENLSLRQNNGTVYNSVYDKNTANQAEGIVVGLEPHDEVLFVTANGTVVPKNAAEYVGKILVRRPVSIDGSDPNNYYAEWKSADITIKVAEASTGLKARTESTVFNGKEFVYALNGIDKRIDFNVNGEIVIEKEYIDISYELLSKGEYKKVDKLLNAGTYRVTVSLNDAFKSVDANKNYAAETVYATFTILRAVVNVSISADGFDSSYVQNGNIVLVAPYEAGRTFAPEYSLRMEEGVPANVAVTKENTQIVFAKEVTSAGKYAFSVELTDDALDRNNYNFVNAAGIVELTTKCVESSDGGQIELENETLANRLVVREIKANNVTGSEFDMWTAIEQYMPHIDKNASVAAVVKLSVYCGDAAVDTTGQTMSVKLAIPESVGSLENKAIYVVTPQGGLSKLSGYAASEDGYIEYTTDRLGTLVFVDLTPNTLPDWALYLIIAGSAIAFIALVWTITALAVRKKNLKKLI